jgi:hypothetical protein
MQVCELCEEETEDVSGCSKCGRLICPMCEAATAEDEVEIICEECF